MKPFEDLKRMAADALLYRTAARPQFVVAGLLLGAGHRGGFRWHVNEGARFTREAGRRDGRGVDVGAPQ